MDTVNSRRKFLLSSSALLLASASASGLAVAQNSGTPLSAIAAPPIDNEDYWQMVRGQFSFVETAVPMNAANLCPSFRAVAENVALMTADIDRDCSFNNRAKFSTLLEDARSQIAQQLKVSTDEVALVRNTSEANNIINNGLQLQAGDGVLLWNENHPTNNVAWDVRAARYGLKISRVTTPQGPIETTALLNAFTSKFNAQTKVLAITHVSNVSGIKLPVAELVKAAHALGIYVHLDGAQTWGAMALDLRALGVDSFSASAHKWYMGPKEVGLLYVKESNIERIWPGVVASGWGSGALTRLAGARKFESLGQRDDAALAGLSAAAAIHNMIGASRIEQRIYFLAQRLKAGVTDLGLQLLTPMDPALSFGVCVIQAPAEQAGEISNRLYAEHGIAGAGTGGVRLCPAIYNTLSHIDRAVSGLKALLT